MLNGGSKLLNWRLGYIDFTAIDTALFNSFNLNLMLIYMKFSYFSNKKILQIKSLYQFVDAVKYPTDPPRPVAQNNISWLSSSLV